MIQCSLKTTLTICLLTIFLSGVAFGDDFSSSGRMKRENPKLKIDSPLTTNDADKIRRGELEKTDKNTRKMDKDIRSEKKNLDRAQDESNGKIDEGDILFDSNGEFPGASYAPDPQPQNQGQDSPETPNQSAVDGKENPPKPPVDKPQNTPVPTPKTTPKEQPKDPSKIPVKVTPEPLPPITNAPIPTSVKVEFEDGHTENMLQSTYDWKFKIIEPAKDAFNKTDFGRGCTEAAKEVGRALGDDYAGAITDGLLDPKKVVANSLSPQKAFKLGGPIVKSLAKNTLNWKIPNMVYQCYKPAGEFIGNFKQAQGNYPSSR